MLGTSETSQSAFTSAQNGGQSTAERSTAMHVTHDLYSQSRGAFLSETFHEAFKGKVHIFQFNCSKLSVGDIVHPASPIPAGQRDVLTF